MPRQLKGIATRTGIITNAERESKQIAENNIHQSVPKIKAPTWLSETLKPRFNWYVEQMEGLEILNMLDANYLAQYVYYEERLEMKYAEYIQSVKNDPSFCPVTLYSLNVIGEYTKAGKSVQKACERHLKDLKNSFNDNYKYEFNRQRADHIFSFYEVYAKHSKGEWDGLIRNNRQDGFRYRTRRLEVRMEKSYCPVDRTV